MKHILKLLKSEEKLHAGTEKYLMEIYLIEKISIKAKPLRLKAPSDGTVLNIAFFPQMVTNFGKNFLKNLPQKIMRILYVLVTICTLNKFK